MTPENACQCDVCKGACVGKPGWFAPNDIEPLAKAMDITVQELFDKHLQVDWYQNFDDTGEEVFVLSPRLKHKKGGTMFPGNPRGECHWFIKGKCKVHALGKPGECARYIHSVDHAESQAIKAEITRAWIPFQSYIQKLYGDELEAEFWFPGL